MPIDPRELWEPNGQVFQRCRKDRGWSRFELACRAGVSPHTVARAERGIPMFPATLRLLASALEKEPHELLSRMITRGEEEGWRAGRIETVRQFWTAFDKGTLARDMTLTEPIWRRVCHERFTLVSTANHDHCNSNDVCQGIDAVLKHVTETFAAYHRLEPYQMDEVRLFGSHQVLCTGVDRVWELTHQAVLAVACVHVFAFRDELIASLHLSSELLTLDGKPVSDVMGKK